MVFISSSEKDKNEKEAFEYIYRLLEEQGLAVVPGGAFGDNDCIRLSCAASDATLQDGLARLRRFIESL